jgi:hypothetical protein
LNEQQPPREICSTVRDWLNTTHENYRGSSYLMNIYPPTHLKKAIRNAPAKYPKRIEGGYVALIQNGRVWGQNGAILTPDNKMIWDVSMEFVGERSEHSIFKVSELPPISEHYGTIADLTHVGSKNYYHWMFDNLPRIPLLQMSGIHIDKYIINIDNKYLPFQHETLNFLGVSEDKIIKTHPHFHLKAENLVVPSQTTWASKWAFEYLRSAFSPWDFQDQYAPKRIYIRRSSTRRILNEEQITDILTKYNFTILDLEKMTIFEQIYHFANADCIVGTHGAGLTNLVFCKQGTKILEIFPPQYVYCFYWLLSSFGNLNYHYFIGDHGERDPDLRNNEWHGYDNLTINFYDFEESLKNLIL